MSMVRTIPHDPVFAVNGPGGTVTVRAGSRCDLVAVLDDSGEPWALPAGPTRRRVAGVRSDGVKGSTSLVPFKLTSTWMNSSPSVAGSPIFRTRPVAPSGNCADREIPTLIVFPTASADRSAPTSIGTGASAARRRGGMAMILPPSNDSGAGVRRRLRGWRVRIRAHKIEIAGQRRTVPGNLLPSGILHDMHAHLLEDVLDLQTRRFQAAEQMLREQAVGSVPVAGDPAGRGGKRDIGADRRLHLGQPGC